jgi:hypothetical protein
MKICNTCKKAKDLDKFKVRMAMKDKKAGWCISCEAEYQQKKHIERKQCRNIRHF